MGFLILLTSPRFILALSAVLPALWLLGYVRKMDRLDAESPALIFSLVMKGIFSTFIALILEEVGTRVLGVLVPEDTLLYWAVMFYIVVAVSEEGAKLFILKKATWNHPEFSSRYDGIVYAVSVSMGFALWENLSYVFRYGLSTAITRAFTAVPGHAAFAVTMGFWYGIAKDYSKNGNTILGKMALWLSFLMPVLIHGTYDFIAATSSDYTGTVAFVIFIVILFLSARRRIRKASLKDRPL